MTPDWNRDGVLVYDLVYRVRREDIRNPLSLLAHEHSHFAAVFKSYHFKDQNFLAFIVPFK